jgi:hypothetical protein
MANAPRHDAPLEHLLDFVPSLQVKRAQSRYCTALSHVQIFFRSPIQRIAQLRLAQHSLAGVFHFLFLVDCCSFPCALRAALEDSGGLAIVGGCREIRSCRKNVRAVHE